MTQRPTAAPVSPLPGGKHLVDLDLTDTGVLERILAAFHQMPPRLDLELRRAMRYPPGTGSHETAVAALKAYPFIAQALHLELDPAQVEDTRYEMGEACFTEPFERAWEDQEAVDL